MRASTGGGACSLHHFSLFLSLWKKGMAGGCGRGQHTFGASAPLSFESSFACTPGDGRMRNGHLGLQQGHLAHTTGHLGLFLALQSHLNFQSPRTTCGCRGKGEVAGLPLPKRDIPLPMAVPLPFPAWLILLNSLACLISSLLNRSTVPS